MITLGDKLSNIRSIYRDYNTIGDALWQRFNQKEKNEHYWYYQSIADCLTELETYPAYKEYCDLIDKTFKNNVL
jgi:myo-inositol-1(or 4)-monophosphatase